MSDLIKKLRAYGTTLGKNAADEIERLTKNVEQYHMAANDLRLQLAECQTMRGASVLVPQAELEAMKKDAERYRWLREGGVYQWFDSTSNVSLDNLDAAIDKAMRGKGE